MPDGRVSAGRHELGASAIQRTEYDRTYQGKFRVDPGTKEEKSGHNTAHRVLQPADGAHRLLRRYQNREFGATGRDESRWAELVQQTGNGVADLRGWFFTGRSWLET